MDYNKRIADFFEGRLTQQEAKEFLEFLESQEAEEYLSAEVIQLWSTKIKAGQYQWDNKDLWNRILESKESYAKPYLLKDQPEIYISWKTWFRAAVVFLVMAVGAAFFINKSSNPEKHEVVTNENFITKSNPNGKKTKLMLDDGSTIYLNSQSSVTYPLEFRTHRTIKLEGEAFFEVAKDSLNPFSVEANGIVTTAVGTSFNISTFNVDEKVAVTLVTGKVKLNQVGKHQFLQLVPGEESILSSTDHNIEKHQVNTLDKILWIEGVLRFDEATFQEMHDILERWYDVEIIVEGSPKNLNASGVFDKQESLRNVMNVMSKTLEFDFEINDQIVTVKFK
tara:strand:- start:690 stop:1700 length:1011 start_codon:yes stop_codon:yes gene_type:complete